MTKDEALRLALEALENSVDLVRENAYSAEQLYGNYPARQGKVRGLKALVEDHEKAITAIKAALEAKDEPVAWVYPEFWQHLENLNCGTAYRLAGIGRQPLYTTPTQRKPLTDEELTEIFSTTKGLDFYLNFARAIEAAHDIKGEA